MRSAGKETLKPAFSGEESFRRRTGPGYELLPLRFLPLDDRRYIVTNFSGEYAVLERPALDDLVRRRLSPHDPLYDRLKSAHFLLDGDSTAALDLLACKFRTRHSRLPDLTGLFLFVVTLRCEHSCPYCQVSRQSADRSAFDMSEEDADRAVDFVFASPSPTLKIEFQGGEPLLNFGLIRRIVERVEECNQTARRDVAFVIATNFALLTDEVLDYCRAHRIALSTSLDGPAELHNENRPRPGGDSHQLAVDGIARARAALGDDLVAALMTTTKASLAQPEAIVDEYVRLDLSSIFLRPLSPFGFAVKTGAVASYDIDEWLGFYRRTLDHIIRWNQRGVRIREEYATTLLRKILTPFPSGYVDLQSPAGVGASCLAFNYDGSIHASDEARMLAETGDASFCLGHLATTSYTDALGAVFETLAATMTESMPMCADCGVQPYCGSDPVYHHATQGDRVGMKPGSGFCRKNMELARHLIRLLEDDPVAADVLRSWIR